MSTVKKRYTLGEEIFNSVTHGVGSLLSIAGTVVLIVFSAINSDAFAVVSSAVYGASLIILYTMSTLYHSITNEKAKKFFRIMDHNTIFFLIAGTYTPYTLAVLRSPLGWVLFGLYFMTGASFAVNADLSLSSDSALPLFAAGILCFAFLTKKLAAYICGRRMSASFVYDVTMTLGGKRYSVKGYLDSGNRLTSDGLPVIIATSGRMRNAVARQAAEDLLGGRARYAEYSTLAGGTRKMPVVECDDITVGGRRLNALVGAAGKTTAAFGCEVLLGAWMDTDGGEK